MAPLVLLVPVLGLVAASLLAHPRVAGGRRTGGFVLAAALVSFAGAVAVAGLAATAGGRPVALAVVPWAGGTFHESVALEATGLTATAIVLVSLLGTLVAARAVAAGEVHHAVGALAVAAASALFVLAASEPLGLVFAWLVLDLVLFTVAGSGRHGLVSGQLGLMLAVGALVALPWDAGPSAEVTYAGLGNVGRFLLLSAGAVRMGLFPVWWTVPLTDRDRPWSGLGVRLAPIVAGGYLVLLLGALSPLGSGLNAPAVLPILVSVMGAAALSWVSGHRVESHDWQIAAQATLFLMAAFVGGGVGQAIGTILLVDLVLVRASVLLGGGRSPGRLGKAVTWLLAAAACGLPPTLGFAGRWLLYRELLFSGLGAAVIVFAVATALTTTALWDAFRLRAADTREPREIRAVVAAMVAAELVLGMALPLAGPVLVQVAGTSVPNPLAEVWLGLTNRLALANTVALLFAVVAPAGVALVVRRTPTAMGDARRREMRRALRLTRAANEAAGAVVRLGALVHRSTGLLESRRAMAWTVMAAAVTATAMMVSEGDAVAAPSGSLHALLGLLVAGSLGAVLVLSKSPAMAIGSLAAGYAFSALLLWSGEVPVQIAFIKLFAGLLAAAILAIGVLQAPIDRHLPGAARRLARARTRPGSGDDRLLPALALVTGLMLAFGVRASGLGGSLPAELLRPALALTASGVVAAVFATTPLRLACGVLLALVGFELIYAPLDPGLLITGALAAFQLMFAVVSSYHVGMPVGGPEAS